MINHFWKNFQAGVQIFGSLIAVIVNTILLLIVYFFAIGPIAIMAKILQKDFLSLRRKKLKSYWLDLPKKHTIESFYQQF